MGRIPLWKVALLISLVVFVSKTIYDGARHLGLSSIRYAERKENKLIIENAPEGILKENAVVLFFHIPKNRWPVDQEESGRGGVLGAASPGDRDEPGAGGPALIFTQAK